MIRLVVLGDPVDHSRSPAIHTAALAAAGIAGTYVARRVDEIGLAEACAQLRAGALDGANITMPHKAEASRLADELTPLARRSGSVNTWYREGDAVVGDSTDGAGVTHALTEAGISPDLKPLILGAGGAAAAALLALEERRPEISARRSDRAAALVERTGVSATVVEWGTSRPGRLLINATPIGMDGETLPAAVGEAAAALLDMAYADSPTPAVENAIRRGVPVADGLSMLIGQAAASFRLWTGQRADIGAMRAAASKTLKGVTDTAENAE